jgi:hypothetical protein
MHNNYREILNFYALGQHLNIDREFYIFHTLHIEKIYNFYNLFILLQPILYKGL